MAIVENRERTNAGKDEEQDGPAQCGWECKNGMELSSKTDKPLEGPAAPTSLFIRYMWSNRCMGSAMKSRCPVDICNPMFTARLLRTAEM